MGWVLVLYVSANKPGKRTAAGLFSPAGDQNIVFSFADSAGTG